MIQQIPIFKFHFRETGATPELSTLGKLSSPMLYSSPIPHDNMAIIATVKPANSQKGTLTSFFWQAGPPQ